MLANGLSRKWRYFLGILLTPLGLLAWSIASEASADVPADPIWLETIPDNAKVGDDITASVIWGSQGLCLEAFVSPQGLEHQVTASQNRINLDLVAEFDLGTACTNLSVYEFYPIGTLEAGIYELVVSHVDRDTVFPATDADRTEVGRMEFGVGIAPIALPINYWPALTLTMLGLLGIGLWAMPRQSMKR